MKAVAALIGTAVALVIAAGALAQTPTGDPPRIEIGSSIGGIRLGMTEGEVVRAYGKPGVITSRKEPSGQTVRLARYELHDGYMRVTYFRRKVAVVLTTSSFYKTPGGNGVGSVIELGSCQRTRTGACVRRWKGFTYDDCGGWLAESPKGVHTLLSGEVKRNGKTRVVSVMIGDADFSVTCF